MTEKQFIKLPEGYKPSDNEDYMNDLQLEYFRRKLLKWREDLSLESSNTVSNLQHEKLNEPDLNDRASAERDINFELRTRDRYRKLIMKIDAALQRIESGTYGFCLETFEPIGLQRLDARPTATLSIVAQENHERTKKVYNEE